MDHHHHPYIPSTTVLGDISGVYTYRIVLRASLLAYTQHFHWSRSIVHLAVFVFVAVNYRASCFLTPSISVTVNHVYTTFCGTFLYSSVYTSTCRFAERAVLRSLGTVLHYVYIIYRASGSLTTTSRVVPARPRMLSIALVLCLRIMSLVICMYNV